MDIGQEKSMRGFNLAAAFAFARSTRPISGGWTCKRCLLQSRRGTRQITNGTFAGKRNGKSYKDWTSGEQRKKGVVLLATTGAAGLGAAAVAFNDDVRHAYETIERTGRVVTALFVCINE